MKKVNKEVIIVIMKKKELITTTTAATAPTTAIDNSSAIVAPIADDIKLISKMANNEELDIFASGDDEDDELDRLFAECGF